MQSYVETLFHHQASTFTDAILQDLLRNWVDESEMLGPITSSRYIPDPYDSLTLRGMRLLDANEQSEESRVGRSRSVTHPSRINERSMSFDAAGPPLEVATLYPYVNTVDSERIEDESYGEQDTVHHYVIRQIEGLEALRQRLESRRVQPAVHLPTLAAQTLTQETGSPVTFDRVSPSAVRTRRLVSANIQPVSDHSSHCMDWNGLVCEAGKYREDRGPVAVTSEVKTSYAVQAPIR